METNENTVSSEEIVAEYDGTSDIQIIGNIDPYFNDTMDRIHEEVVFDSTYKFKRSYNTKEIAISLYLDTDTTEAHLGGSDGAYSFNITSSGGRVKYDFVDPDEPPTDNEEETEEETDETYSNSINVAKLLTDKKLYIIRIEPEDLDTPITINVEIFYTPYRNLGNKNIYENTDSLTVRKGDIMTLHFKGSSEVCMWSSNNSNIVSIDDTTGRMVARDFGKTTILVSNACGYCHRFEVKVVVDYVDIFDEGYGLQYISFRNSASKWYCVYADTIFANSKTKITTRRDNYNRYADYDFENDIALSDNIKKFSDEELRFIFAIDPLGVANYIKNITEDWSITKAMNKKDEYFKVFFGRDPWYFKLNSSGEWVKKRKPSSGNIEEYISESELIMGGHVAWSKNVVLDIIKSIMGLIFDIITSSIASTDIIKSFLENHKEIEDIISIHQFCTCDSFGDAISNVSDLEFDEMYKSTDFTWMNTIMSVASFIEDLNYKLTGGNTLYPQKLEYCIGDNNYEIYLCKGTNVKYKLNDFSELK